MSGESQKKDTDSPNSVLLGIEVKMTTMCESYDEKPHTHSDINIVADDSESCKITQALIQVENSQNASGKFGSHVCGSAKHRLKSLCDKHYGVSKAHVSKLEQTPPYCLAPGIYNMYILNGIAYFGTPP